MLDVMSGREARDCLSTGYRHGVLDHSSSIRPVPKNFRESIAIVIQAWTRSRRRRRPVLQLSAMSMSAPYQQPYPTATSSDRQIRGRSASPPSVGGAMTRSSRRSLNGQAFRLMREKWRHGHRHDFGGGDGEHAGWHRRDQRRSPPRRRLTTSRTTSRAAERRRDTSPRPCICSTSPGLDSFPTKMHGGSTGTR